METSAAERVPSRRRAVPRPPPAPDDPFVVLPGPLAWGIVLVSVLPSLLILFGVDLSASPPDLSAAVAGDLDAVRRALGGSRSHTLLEWTSVCIAAMAAAAALLHFRNTRHPVTPVIFVALLAAATADLAHLVMSDRFLTGLADAPHRASLAWGLGRVYFAGILVVGVARELRLGVRSPQRSSRGSIGGLIGVAAAAAAGGLLLLLLGVNVLPPQSIVRPDALVARPLDVLPLVVLLVGAAGLFPVLHRRAPSIFSHSLLLTTLPAVATQIHMAFGSREPFDAHYQSAHLLKVVTYFVPLVGLAFDYARTYERTAIDRTRLENEIRLRRDMQDQLYSTEAVNEAILASVGDAIVTVDAAGRIEVFNPAAEAMFGYDAGEAGGRPATILAAEAWRAPLGGLVDRTTAGRDAELLSTHFEMSGARADGLEFPVELTIAEFEVEGRVRCALVLRDMTEHRRARAALADQAAQLQVRTEELQRSNQELEKFAYVASHDLQEPLRMVYSFTDVLADHLGDDLDAEGREYMDFVQDGVGRMRTMIADLLTFSRVGGPTSEHLSIALGDALDRALGNLRAAIEESGAVLHVESLPRVRADPGEVAQVLQNLVGNAIKFRGDGVPEIRISAERTGAFVRVEVSDSGIGIDMEYAEKIFVLFQRLHTHDRYPGTGIGLALCRKIVERYGGAITVESALGEGATFRFTLPAG